MKIGEKIKQLRGNKYSQEELAELLHVHNNTVSRWENGTMQPRIQNIKEMAEIFRVPSTYLIEDDIESSSFSKNSSYQDTTEIMDSTPSMAYWGTLIDNAKKAAENGNDLDFVMYSLEKAINIIKKKMTQMNLAENLSMA